jgi:hypothetical protein
VLWWRPGGDPRPGDKTEILRGVPRGIALDELNLDREQPFTDADLTRALNELRIQDYPQRARAHAGGDMTRRADPPASSCESDDSSKGN